MVVWGATLASLSQNGHYHWLLDAGIILLLLYLLFFAEGLELAVADLLDKQPEQLHDARLRKLLHEIQQRRDFFFGTRQVFVVVIISFMSLRTTYPWISVPLVGQISEHESPFWFSLVFTSLTVLWACQVTPKRLAVMNSELFLQHSAFLWPFIRLIGLLGLPNPSDQLVYLFERFTPYRRKRHLLPSPAAHYNTTSQIHGLALDRLHVEVTVGEGHPATVRKRFAVLFLRGSHSEHSGSQYCHAGFSTPPAIRVIGLFTASAPERLETIKDALDAIFAGQRPSEAFERIEGWPHRVESHLEPDLLRGGQWAKWAIRSFRPLPEAYWRDDELAERTRATLVVLLYDVEFNLLEGALVSRYSKTGDEHVWPECVDVPCRLYTINVKTLRATDVVALQGCEVRLLPRNTAVTEETTRCSQRAIAAHDGKLQVCYPVPNAVYSLRWWHMGSSAVAACVQQMPELVGPSPVTPPERF
jgi:hypothetical protein